MLVAVILADHSCGSSSVKANLWGDGELIILTRNAPTTYYEGRDETSEGFEHDLATAFAQHLGLKPRFVVLDSTAAILQAIEANQGHIAAAGLTRTAEREARYQFGPSYLDVWQEIVCTEKGPLPRTFAELCGKSLMVIGDSSYSERLEYLGKEFPEVTWTSTYEEETEQLLEHVWLGELDCTVADSNIVEINRRYFPELKVGFRIGEKQPLAWVVASEAAALEQQLEEWFGEQRRNGFLAALEERYFGHVERFNYENLRHFNARLDERLPQYKPLFAAAEKRHGIPWTLLAAVSYQESHWDPNAESRTGVRGLMMLTEQTAAHLGISDRENPQESILGAARYLKQLHQRLPEPIEEPDRTWIALASYNVGYSHVEDAQLLAEQQGLNPYLWNDLQQTLVLLTKRKYYQDLPHGYARGYETVRFVQSVRNYQDILEKYEKDHVGK